MSKPILVRQANEAFAAFAKFGTSQDKQGRVLSYEVTQEFLSKGQEVDEGDELVDRLVRDGIIGLDNERKEVSAVKAITAAFSGLSNKESADPNDPEKLLIAVKRLSQIFAKDRNNFSQGLKLLSDDKQNHDRSELQKVVEEIAKIEARAILGRLENLYKAAKNLRHAISVIIKKEKEEVDYIAFGGSDRSSRRSSETTIADTIPEINNDAPAYEDPETDPVGGYAFVTDETGAEDIAEAFHRYSERQAAGYEYSEVDPTPPVRTTAPEPFGSGDGAKLSAANSPFSTNRRTNIKVLGELKELPKSQPSSPKPPRSETHRQVPETPTEMPETPTERWGREGSDHTFPTISSYKPTITIKESDSPKDTSQQQTISRHSSISSADEDEISADRDNDLFSPAEAGLFGNLDKLDEDALNEAANKTESRLKAVREDAPRSSIASFFSRILGAISSRGR